MQTKTFRGKVERFATNTSPRCELVHRKGEHFSLLTHNRLFSLLSGKYTKVPSAPQKVVARGVEEEEKEREERKGQRRRSRCEIATPGQLSHVDLRIFRVRGPTSFLLPPSLLPTYPLLLDSRRSRCCSAEILSSRSRLTKRWPGSGGGKRGTFGNRSEVRVPDSLSR